MQKTRIVMKKKTLLKLLFTASCLLASYSLFYNNETATLNKLAFQNIEALANGENEEYVECFGYGSIDCQTFKVEMKITGFSLE